MQSSQPRVRARPRTSRRLKKALHIDSARIQALRRRLLTWAAREGRSFFWRRPGLDAYSALVTEILLVKTRAELVATVARDVLARYPTAEALAQAEWRTLASLLYPLGLHRKRANGLIACARALVDQHGGRVPGTIEQLLELPYVGRYAATAVACVAYDAPVAVLDANVSRIYQRMFSLPAPPDRLASAHELWSTAQHILPEANAKRFNWAILDLGGMICKAKAPSCSRCPVSSICDSYRSETRTRGSWRAPA